MFSHVYQSTKTYVHSVGLSVCFRQWKAKSHCRFLHGYSLEIELVFEASKLDKHGWVVDFGDLKSFKAELQNTFDHKTLVAQDDPMKPTFENLNAAKLIQMVEVEATGCEAFAKMVFIQAHLWLQTNEYAPRCIIRSVEVREHGANSSIYKRID